MTKNGQHSEAQAGSERLGQFTALESGTATICVDYTYNMDVSTSRDDEKAHGIVWMTLDLVNLFGSDSMADQVYNSKFVSDGNSFGPYTEIGCLKASVNFAVGESGAFSLWSAVYSEAETPIPEPMRFLLLGSGLVSLAFGRKKIIGLN